MLDQGGDERAELARGNSPHRTDARAPFGPDMVVLPSIATEANRLHLALQRELVSRSPRGRQVIAEKSGHLIYQDQPELVVSAIREVVEESRRWKAE